MAQNRIELLRCSTARKALAVRKRLAKTHPDNTDWQRDLSIAANEFGDVLVEQGAAAEALKAYRDNLTVSERLAKADPNNADWQRDLATTHERIGDVLVKRGYLSDALTSYRDSLDVP